MSRALVVFQMFSFLLLFLSANLYAQVSNGITGTVTTAGGKYVDHAVISATDQATEAVTRAFSSSAGRYVIDLTPGSYTVRIEKDGFKTTVVDKVVVQVSMFTTVDTGLAPGNPSDIVETTADALPMEQTQPEIGTVIDSRQLDALPFEFGIHSNIFQEGRQVTDLPLLSLGVQNLYSDIYAIRIDGGLDLQQETLFNGIPVVQPELQGNLNDVAPPYEMVDQLNAVSSVFSPQYGIGQGAINYHFASGTNKLHGDAFEILRNNMLDAKGGAPTLDAAGHPITPPDNEHNYGFALGGPVVLPHVYDGRDKTFFFSSLEWYHWNVPLIADGFDPAQMTVPTDAMKNGDFSALLAQGTKIYVPFTAVPLPAGCTPGAAPGSPFPGNIIPQDCISAVSKSILSLIPSPDNSALVDNKNPQVTKEPYRQINGGVSLDHRLTPNQSLHGSFWRNTLDISGNGGTFNNVLSSNIDLHTVGTGLFLNYSNAIRPNLVFTSGLGWMGDLFQEPNPHTYNFSAVVSGGVFPSINFMGTSPNPTNWGNALADYNDRDLGVSLANNLVWVHGRHTTNIGLEIRRSYQDEINCSYCNGEFSFDGFYTSDPFTATGGNAFATFLLGQTSYVRASTQPSDLRNLLFAPYIQDTFKLTSRLTVSGGLRWDIMRPFTEANNNFVFFDATASNPGAINPTTGQPLLGAASKFGNCAGCAGYSMADTHWLQFSPRLGFAYQLSDKMVVRAGYSLNHLDAGSYEFGTSVVGSNYGTMLNGGNPNQFSLLSQWDTTTLAVPPLQTFSPAMANGAFNSSGAFHYVPLHQFTRDPGMAPYVQSWNAAISRELPRDFVLTVAYVGNRGTHLPSQLNNPDQLNPKYLSLGSTLNDTWVSTAGQAALQANGFSQTTVTCPSGFSGTYYVPYANFLCDFGPFATVGQALRPYPMFPYQVTNNFDLSGVSDYQALQAQVQKRFGNGLSVLANYTLSRTMSNTDFTAAENNLPALNTFNQGAEWSISALDQTHVLNIAEIYELPFGPGKRFLNRGGKLGRNLWGGWQFSGVYTYSSGLPTPIFAGNDVLGTVNRANVVPGQSLNVNWNNYYKGNFNTSGILGPSGVPVMNVNAFSNPGPYALGNAPRLIGDLRSPYHANESMALGKELFFSEGVTAEFRAEFFNVLNRMQICGLNNDFANEVTNPSSFGIIAGGNKCQANLPRQGEFFFKLRF